VLIRLFGHVLGVEAAQLQDTERANLLAFDVVHVGEEGLPALDQL
jgi:hypothetical protein